MSGSGPSTVAVPLAEKLGLDRETGQIKAAGSREFDVLVHLDPGAVDQAASHARGVGATVRSQYDDVMFATVRGNRVSSLATGSGIRKIEEHSDPMEHSVSEGVTTTKVDQLHSLGLKGGDVTVAIIDLYFNPNQPEIKDQVSAQIGYSSSFRDIPRLHGTACAEIVSEMLPNADLVLASASGIFFPNLMDYITSQANPDLMSMSLGYKQTIRLDGQDYISNRIKQYTSGSGANTSEGGLFAVSAGNDAYGAHFDRQWTDTSGNGYLEFEDDGTEFFEVTTKNSGQEVVVQSDADWRTDQGYSIEVYDSNKNLLKSPARTSAPSQAVVVPGSDGSTTTSYVRIKDESLDGTEHFDFFAWGNYVTFPTYTSERSVGIPATSPDSNTLSTGAVRHDTDGLEDFSSRGPTQDGRRGVDVVAPDGTQSDTYSGKFYGTSAACPHAAGAAGLMLEFSAVRNVDAREVLYDTTRDISDSSVSSPPNREIGNGYVDADAALDELIGLNQSWSRDTGGRTQYSSPAADSDRVFVGGLDRTLYAYFRTDGGLAWKTDRDGALSDSSPHVAGGAVYVGSGGGTLYALDAADGTTNWTRSVDSAITASPVVLDGTVFVGTNDGRVLARSTTDGTEVWTTTVDGPVYSDLAAASGLVFVTTNDGRLLCLDAGDGSEQWAVDTGATLGASSPAIGGGRVYVGADDVHAYDLSATKSQAWTQTYGGTAGSTPAYNDGRVFVGDADGTLYALDDGNDGAGLWSQSIGTTVTASPSAVGDRVTVPSLGGTLYVFLASDGTRLGSVSLGSNSRSPPLVVNDDVYLGVRDGTFLAR